MYFAYWHNPSIDLKALEHNYWFKLPKELIFTKVCGVPNSRRRIKAHCPKQRKKAWLYVMATTVQSSLNKKDQRRSLMELFSMHPLSIYMKCIFWVDRMRYISRQQQDTILVLHVAWLKCDLNGSLAFEFIVYLGTLSIVSHYKELKALQSLFINLWEKYIFLAATMTTGSPILSWDA